MTFSEKLMQLRRQKGWSQEELGEKLDVTRQTVSKWELGSTTPEMEKLIAMSELFGISIDELVKDRRRYPKLSREWCALANGKAAAHGAVCLLFISMRVAKPKALLQ